MSTNKCLSCEYLQYEVDEYYNCHVRCTKKTPPTKGKIIHWSCTVLNGPYTFSVEEKGVDRCRKYMNKRKNSPPWCPLNI